MTASLLDARPGRRTSRPGGADPTRVQRRRRGAVTVALLGAGTVGAVLGTLQPRGPLTNVEGVATVLTGVVVGWAVGRLLRSRWATLAAPLTVAVGVELARLEVAGPSVDLPRLDTSIGIVAAVLGRGVDALLLLLPLALAASVGAAAARRHDAVPAGDGRRWARLARRATTATLTVLVAALTVAIALPPRTAAIVDAAGAPVPGSVAEVVRARIGGVEQTIVLRGHDRDAPVLLWLAGGPGGTDVGPMRNLGGDLEDAFVVATWDQRGTGSSYAALDPTSAVTFERAVRDTLEVTDLLRDRFGRDRIVIAGNSWGTLPSAVAAARHPERYLAFVGAGQMVSIRATDQRFYEDTVRYAREHGDAALEATLGELGPPPYADVHDYVPGVFGGEHLWNVYPRVPGSTTRGEMPANILATEHGLLAGLRSGLATIDTLAVLYPRAQDVDLRTDVPRLEVPVLLVQGRHEAPGRAELAEAWFARLDAPSKRLVILERSGHRPMTEEPARFAEEVRDLVAELPVPPV